MIQKSIPYRMSYSYNGFYIPLVCKKLIEQHNNLRSTYRAIIKAHNKLINTHVDNARNISYIYILSEIRQGLGRILSCGARKPE